MSYACVRSKFAYVLLTRFIFQGHTTEICSDKMKSDSRSVYFHYNTTDNIHTEFY